MKTSGRTIKDRRQLWSELSKKFDRWMTMSDDDLLQEVKVLFPACIEATRDQCLKFLVMDHSEKMIGG